MWWVLVDKRRKRPDTGSVAIFVAAVILPILFLVLTLSLDLGAYFRESQRAQKALDDSAMYAYRYLPYVETAKTAASSYLAQFGTLTAGTTISVNTRFANGADPVDYVSLHLTTTQQLTFPKIFGLDVSLPIDVYSKVRGTPFDTVIALDVSMYLAPDPRNGPAWGDLGSWPTAQFFSNGSYVPHDEFGTVPDLNLVTQQCFNPAFNELKLSALRAYDYLAAFATNSVGIMYYPGGSLGVELGRDVLKGGNRVAFDGSNIGEIDFPQYTDTVAGDVHCAAAAEKEISTDHYKFPIANSFIEGSSQGSQDGKPDSRVVEDSPAVWIFNGAYQPFLTTREALWSKAVHSHVVGDIDDLLSELRSHLIGSSIVTNRGGLTTNTVKTGIIFAGDVPHINGERYPDGAVQNLLKAQIDAIKLDIDTYGNKVALYYILFPHDGNSTDLSARVDVLRAFFATQKGGVTSGSFDIGLVYGETPQALTNNVLGSLVLEKKTTVVSQ